MTTNHRRPKMREAGLRIHVTVLREAPKLETKMLVMRTLIIAGAVALSANAAFASGGRGGQWIRDQGLPGHEATQMWHGSHALTEGRASVDTPAPVYRTRNQPSRSVRH